MPPPPIFAPDGTLDPNSRFGFTKIGNNPVQCGVTGLNTATNAVGRLGGEDPVFREHAGVYGESDKQGVTGVTTTDFPFSTGVFGFSQNGGGIGVRGETASGTAILGRSFGTGLAGSFQGSVAITGDLNISGKLSVTGNDVVQLIQTLQQDVNQLERDVNQWQEEWKRDHQPPPPFPVPPEHGDPGIPHEGDPADPEPGDPSEEGDEGSEG